MKYSKIPLAQTITSLCKMHHIAHIVISPGSRNAPLTIGFTHDTFFKCYSIVDERCAAFFALGIAQQLQQPVALVCTSGSALLNYYPAVSEAFYSQIPLVVLSADRPKYLVDIGDGQTIKQKNVYGEHVHYSANLKLNLREDAKHQKHDDLPIFKSIENKLERFLGIKKDIQTYNENQINTALSESVLKSGPVHINIPFDEPLYGIVEDLIVNPQPYQIPKVTEYIDAEVLSEIGSVWQNAKRKLVLVGVLQPNTLEQQWLDTLIEDDSVVMLTETTSNLHHPDIFSAIDQLIAPLNAKDFERLQPDVLLTFGGLVVSKKVKAFLRQYKPKHHWHVDLRRANDTFFSLEKHFTVSPNHFFSKFLPQINAVSSTYKSYWLAVRDHRRVKHEQYLNTLAFSDFTVFNVVLKTIPSQSQLQVGNSSAIRYTQLFQLKSNIHVFCNRGTSGIDGSTSTAIGAAFASKQRTTFITGDLSFFYDSNALWNNYIPETFRIIVINNEGGGIFRILPGHKNTTNFDTYFETKHQLTAKHLCHMFGFEYHEASNEDTLNVQLETFYKPSTQPKLLEVFTPSRLNDTILLEYFNAVR